MSEIKEGDKVVRRGVSVPTVWTVKAVRGGELWLYNKTVGDHVQRASDMVKVEQKFEVGKTYRPIEEKTLDFIIKIESVNDRWAIGWLKNGEPWHLEQSLRDLWVEVTDRQVAIDKVLNESAEVAAEKVRRMTNVTLTTYHPENYILHDTNDRSQWKIAPGGIWVLHKPPYLMF